ncbi:protein DD3-3 [Exaiptasia diaphana]|uniref:Protein DD3-3 n=1 Tax=Exaiptasia diaphana TaxID=2652724 RepID=A0A913WQ21_EXADI|nr:protein DD3-3 [Exaiptasia diaphana]
MGKTDPNSHCDVILQYMCGGNIRDGVTTGTIPENPVLCKKFDCNKDLRYGMHEDYDYYQNCKHRNRNLGLFLADQRLKGNSAKYTRQNNGGTRRGYECPEERDYYPYWHPTPWKDIAVLTNDASRCNMYLEESENVKGRYACEVPKNYKAAKGWRNYYIPNNKEECEKFRYPAKDLNGTRATWKLFPSHELPKPVCRETDWSRDNHLGNSVGGYPIGFNWTIPDLNSENCVLRIRYNISTGEFNGWDSSVNASLNKPLKKGKASLLDVGKRFGLNYTQASERGYLFKQNPVVSIFGGEIGKKFQLQLAINTNQIGRVFQDRSHTFGVRRRPSNLAGKTIHNLNVRGKRGNIVQVYPAVEYDFAPNTLIAKNGDYVHFQWTGSNTNPNNNDGQGRARTDRSNVLLLEKLRYPKGKPKSNVYGQFGGSYPEHFDRVSFLGLKRNDLITLATLNNVQYGGEMSELDDAGTYFDLGPRSITGTGTYHYMSSRNNNFSNRSQKGRIVLSDTALYTSKIGVNGGTIKFREPGEGITFKPKTLAQMQNIQVERMPSDKGDEMIKGKNGKMGVGNDYASDFLVISPHSLKTDQKFEVKMGYKSGVTDDIEVYRSDDDEGLRTWYQVEAKTSSEDNMVTFQTDKGGVYVARTVTNKGLLAGIIIAVIFVLLIVGGSIIYFRRKPEKLARVRSCFSNCGRSFSRQV